MVFSLTTSAFAQSTVDETVTQNTDIVSQYDEDASIRQGNIIGEDTTKRDEYTKHFITDLGTTIVAQYAVPVHYKNADGEYVDYDNSLKSSETTIVAATQDEATVDEVSTYSLRAVQEAVETEEIFVNKDSDSKVSHLKKSGKAKLIEISRDGHVISWGYSGANIVSAIEHKTINEKPVGNEAYLNLQNLSSTVVYENIYNNVDLEVINSTTGVKENIILKESNAKNVFKLEYNIGDLIAENKDNRTIELKDASGTVVYTISAPYMKDAKGVESEALELKILQSNKGKLSVKLTADKSWLKDKERVYPVTIDPYFTYGQDWGNVHSTYVSQYEPNKCFGYGSSGYEGSIYVGRPDADSKLRRSLIKIPNLPQLGIGDMVVYANINLFHEDNYLTQDLYIGAYEATSSWSQSTVTWNTQPTRSSALIDYEIAEAYTYGWHDWDITELVKKWYNGSSNNGLYLVMMNEADYYQGLRFISSTRPADEEEKPLFQIEFRNNRGVESNWNYTTVSAGNAGVAYINDYSGNLVFRTAIADTHGLKLPVSSYITYNSNMADASYRAGGVPFGYGWKMNFNQSVFSTAEYSLKAIDKAKFPYVYTDEDGTDHYFYKKTENNTTQYLDEDGLGLELKVTDTEFIITDKDNAKLHFARSTNLLTKIVSSTGQTVILNYVSGTNRISKINDANGNTLNVSYNGNITSITDPSGRATAFGYNSEGEYLTSITTPDGNVVRYTYNSDGMLTKVTDVDGTYITFAYSDNGSRGVKTVQEFAADGTAGQKLTFDRTKFNTTIMRSAGSDCDFGNSDDILTTYHFDNVGRTKTVSCKTAGGKDLGAAATTYTSDLNSTASNIKSVNKIKQSYSLGANKENLVVNHNLESTNNWKKAAWGANETNTVDYTISTDTTSPLYGKGTLKMKVNTVTGNARGRVYQDVPVTYLEPGATYTLSCYVKTENISPVSGVENYGAVICATTFNTDGTLKDNYSDHIRSATTTDINNGYRRISVTFTTASNINYIRVNLALRSATGTAYFDAVQLEKSDAPSNYNLLENASLERCESLAVPNSWVGSSNLTMSTSSDTTSTGHVDGKISFRIKGEVDKRKNIYQDVYVTKGSSELDTYILSGWATAHSVPKETNSSCFRLLARVYFTDGTYKNNNIYFNTTLEQGTWQYATSAFTLSDGTSATKTPSYIRVYLSYDRQGNYAYFDNISLTKEAVPSYTYDSEGNLVSVVANAKQNSAYEYASNKLTKYVDPKGNKYEYTYYDDAAKQLKTAKTQKGATYTYTYDEAGNATSVVGSANGLGSLKSDASYNYTTESGTTYSVTATDQDGKSSTEVYDSKTGTLKSTTDTKGITTTYTYDAETDLMESVSKGNQSVEYTYDAFGKLIGISHEGTVYTFGYDKFGNRTTTAVGSRVLSTNTYDSKNGNLLSESYGNSSEVAYTYDVFGNIASMSYNGTVVQRNYTDSAGNINRTQDLLTNFEHRVTYDSTGRLTSKEVLDLSASGDRWLHSLEYNYDLNNNITYIAYADKQGSNVTQYEYGLDNLLEKTTLHNSKEVTYTYDTFGRITDKVLNTTTPINHAYTYKASDRGNGYTTTKIETEQIGDTTYKYTYDAYGNITKVQKVNEDNSETTLLTYIYDEYNQLKSVNDQKTDTYTTYFYDESGNITRKYIQNLHPTYGYPVGVKSDVTYTYGNSNWKDLLTTYNGQTITYDAVGNPLNYRDGISLTWQNGRELASYSDSSNNITYTYDASGMRTGKSVTASSGTTTNYSYVYENGLLQKMTRGNRILEFSYDANDTPVSIKYRSSADATPVYYYYGINSCGDVVSLYNSNGTIAAKYEYDAYGKLIGVTTSAGIVITGETSIAILNPLRYRSYVYDNETELYYIQSRYYDPTTCRFVNADTMDVLTATPMALTDKNLFAYCDNNPINRADDDGYFWHIVVGAAIGAVISGALTVATNIAKGNSWNEGLGISMLSGAASGALAATGVGVVGMAVGGAAISMAENTVSQVVDNNGFNNFDVGDMVFDGVIGGVTGAIGGAGNGSKHLTNLGKQTVKRTFKTTVNKGFKAGAKEAGKAFAYYGKNTVKYYSKLGKGVLKDVGIGIGEAIVDYSSFKYCRRYCK